MVGRWAIPLFALTFLACSRPFPVPTPTATPTSNPSPSGAISVDHPAGETDLVLRMTVYEWPWPVLVLEPAELSLYGDGEVIYLVTVSPLGQQPRSFELRHAQLSTQQMDGVLQDALETGGLATANGSYDDATLVDRETTIFEIHAAGLDKTVSAFALSEITADPEHAADRAKLRYLSDRLGEFAHDVTAGRVTDLGVFRPLAYRVTMSVSRDPETNAEWPWPDLTMDRLDTAPDGGLTGTISRTEAAAALDLGIEESLVAAAPNGTVYRVQIQPMLPDETQGMLR